MMELEQPTGMDRDSSQPAFRPLMETIGFLMFQWSVLEHDLGEEIARLRAQSGDFAPSKNRLRATASERLAEWRALQSRRRRKDAEFHRSVEALGERIQSLARMRNLVTQGFVTAAAEPGSASNAWIMCSTNAGGGTPDMRLTLAQLADAVEEMNRCREELAMLGAG